MDQAELSAARESRDWRVMTFVSGSVGGRQAVSKLCSQAAKHIATMGMPIIKLGTESTSTRLMAGWTSRFSPSCAGPAMPPANRPRCPRRKKWTTLSHFDGRRTKERRVLLASVASREDLFQ